MADTASVKIILLTGFSPSVHESSIKELLDNYGTLVHVDIIRDGNSQTPFVLVRMDISYERAFDMVRRFTTYWFDGAIISAHLLPYR